MNVSMGTYIEYNRVYGDGSEEQVPYERMETLQRPDFEAKYAPQDAVS